MIDKLKKTLTQAGDMIKEQATSISTGALDKSYDLYEDWATVFPLLEDYGFETINFTFSVSLSPHITVIMKGDTNHFTEEYIEEILQENKNDKTMLSVLKTLQTAHNLYYKTGITPFDNVYLKVVVGIPPEIRVSFGDIEVF